MDQKITFVLLNSHISAIKAKGVKESRIDITHQCILSIIDSPLNKTESVTIFIKTLKNELIKIEGYTKIPRSLHRFEGLMCDCMKKRKIMNGRETLMKVVKNPLDDHLRPNAVKIGLSKDGKKLEDCNLEDGKKRGFVVYLNANQKGKDEFGDVEHTIKLSDFDLSAFVCCNRICGFFEKYFDIF